MWRALSGNVPAEAGELAAPRLEQLALRRVARLSPEDQLGMMLGQGSHPPSSKRLRKERTRAIGALAEDPALEENFARIEDRWLKRLLVDTASRGLLYATPEELVEVKVLIARNLFFDRRKVTRESVRTEFQRLLELRVRYEGIPVFSGRDVVLVASDARAETDGPPIFGGSGLRGSLKREARGVTSYGGSSPSASPHRVLAQLEVMDQLTFVFTGHGRSRALKYRGALKAQELARALAASTRGKGEPVIAVLLACSAHDFARNLLASFEQLEPDLPKPILITPEEYGQPWIKAGYGSELARSLGSHSNAVTLGDLGMDWGLGASVFVPDLQNVPRQIF